MFSASLLPFLFFYVSFSFTILSKLSRSGRMRLFPSFVSGTILGCSAFRHDGRGVEGDGINEMKVVRGIIGPDWRIRDGEVWSEK